MIATHDSSRGRVTPILDWMLDLLVAPLLSIRTGFMILLCGISGASGAVPGTHASTHPADGPDADVRILIGRQDVRVIVTVNLLFADALVGVLRENRDVLDPVEHPALRSALFRWFQKEQKVWIDGIEVAPVEAGFAVEDPDLALLPLFPRFGTRAMTKARLELKYSAKSIPEEFRIRWAAFPPDLALETADGAPPVEVVALVLADGREEETTFRFDEPEYRWKRSTNDGDARFAALPRARGRAMWDVPLVSASLIGLFAILLFGVLVVRGVGAAGKFVLYNTIPAALLAGIAWPYQRVSIPSPLDTEPLPTPAEARQVFESLHANVYRAFDYATEDEIYDALARSVHGRLLEELYDSIYQGLVMREEGGAVSRVKNVELLAADIAAPEVVESAATFDVDAKWRVRGEVFHWGHGHRSTNEYEARYRVARVGETWRIVDHTSKSSRVVKTEPGTDR